MTNRALVDYDYASFEFKYITAIGECWCDSLKVCEAV